MTKTQAFEKGESINLADMTPGMSGFVSHIQVNGLLYRRLLDLGIVEGSKIEAVFESPSGDPVVYRVRGADIALRRADAALVDVANRPPATPQTGCGSATLRSARCHTCSSGFNSVAPEQADRTKPFLVALAGNPNTGKSTVFNALTGLRQHVGNWPGKTVMRAEGQWKYDDQEFKLVDLPGTYSLLSTSVEEEIARDFILFGKPDCTVVVADATCLERNLNLVVQILQITDRVVLCVNLLDEAKRKGIEVDTDALSERLGVPVVGTAARKGQGLRKLQKAIMGVALGETTTNPVCLRYDDALEAAVEDLVPHVEEALPGVPNPRWVALRLIDGGDPRIMEEVREGLLTSVPGQIGEMSLPAGMAADGREPRR